MKTSVFLIPACAALFISCNLIEAPLSVDGHHRDSSLPKTGTDQETDPVHSRDTVFIISAVEFPGSYDWQQDSASGAVDCKLRLYRGERLSLEIPAGPAAQVGVSPDKHHLIGSSLFTEYSDRSGTIIKKDGILLGKWNEAEKLQGLLFKDNCLHTLGLTLPGGALTYRRDGDIVIRAGGGIPLGGFGVNCYGSGGALYEDGGSVCFAYKTVLGGVQTAFLIKDGKTEKQWSAAGADYLDARMMDGVPTVLYNQNNTSILEQGRTVLHMVNGWGLRWLDGHVLDYLDRPCVAGAFIDYRGGISCGVGWQSNCVVLPGSPVYIYTDVERISGIEQPPKEYGDCYFFHRDCACMVGGEVALALTPKNTTEPPFVKYGSRIIEYKLHGYLSGIAVELPE